MKKRTRKDYKKKIDKSTSDKTGNQAAAPSETTNENRRRLKDADDKQPVDLIGQAQESVYRIWDFLELLTAIELPKDDAGAGNVSRGVRAYAGMLTMMAMDVHSLLGESIEVLKREPACAAAEAQFVNAPELDVENFSHPAEAKAERSPARRSRRAFK